MTPPRLFHVSEDAGIARFDPRPSPSTDAGVIGTAVWALSEPFLPNYLLPRDCPDLAGERGPDPRDDGGRRAVGPHGDGGGSAGAAGLLAALRRGGAIEPALLDHPQAERGAPKGLGASA